MIEPPLACPLDNHPLVRDGNSWVCPDGHRYDRARQGYLHLLPVQFKRSRQPGDSEAMIAARSGWLEAGWYDGIAAAIERMVSGVLPPQGVLLDAGCGEGWYTQRLASHYPEAGVIGLDISKPAILAAARRSKAVTWLVASNKRIPLQRGSVDVLLSAFGFPVWPAFRHVLKPDGHVLLVDPGEDHLLALREQIYDDVRRTPLPGLEVAEQLGFEQIDETRFCADLGDVPAEDLHNLLVMTPHLYRASAQGKQAVARLSAIRLGVDVRLRLLRKAL